GKSSRRRRLCPRGGHGKGVRHRSGPTRRGRRRADPRWARRHGGSPRRPPVPFGPRAADLRRNDRDPASADCGAAPQAAGIVRIVSIGGGPAGLYFAILMKKADPAHDVLVLERNRLDDTFGFGVVFSEATQ